MNDDTSQVLYLIIDRGYTMVNQKTKFLEYKCMDTFFNMIKKIHCKLSFGLGTFNETTKIICNLTTNINMLFQKYQSIKNTHETVMYENNSIIKSNRAKYRKCYDAINVCAKELINKKYQFPDAMFRILVITDGTIDQSDAITLSKLANLLTINKIYLDFVIINGWISPIVNKMSNWSGGSVFQIASQKDIDNVFGNQAFYDPRIRKFKKPKLYKITYEMIEKNDIKNKTNIEKSIVSMYKNQNKTNNAQMKDDSKLIDAMKKIKEMEESILKITKDIKKQINEAPNATIILLVGNTGNGKSTFMHCMYGKRMDRLRIDNRWVLNIENMPLNERNPLGHNGKSKTRTVDFMYVPHLNIIFVDCPGYFDSAGPDQNLINSIAINQVFNGTKSLQMKILAFVSNDDFGQRLGAIIDALNMVYGLIPNIEILKKGLGVVITKSRKPDEKRNLKKIESISKSKSKTINSTWEITEFISHAHTNQRIWNFPSPEGEFKPGRFDNFPDSNKIKEFMAHNPILDPPHSIPLDTHSFEMIIDLIHIVGNCKLLVNNIFDKISQEYLLNKMNISALKCWRCQIKKITKMRFNSLGEFVCQIETILPFPENYADIFKSMNLLTIFQTFIGDVKNQKEKKKDIFNSLNRHQKDFFCEQDIITKALDSLTTLNGYIYDAEKEEKSIMDRREECERKDSEFLMAKLEFFERIQRANDMKISLDISIEAEERRLIQQKFDLEAYKKKVNHDYKLKYQRIIDHMQSEHSNWIKNAEDEINSLQRKLNATEYHKKYLQNCINSF